MVEFCDECSDTTQLFVAANSCADKKEGDDGCTTFTSCEGGVSVQECGSASDNDYMQHFSKMLPSEAVSV